MKFSRIAVMAAVLAVFSLILVACPPLEEDRVENILAYEGFLDSEKWFEILDDVAAQGKLVTLDLSACDYRPGNEGGGLIKVTLYDLLEETDLNYKEVDYIAFDPFPVVRMGKDKIESIILPDAAHMINQATANRVGEENEEDIRKSAFYNFTKLRSVSAKEVVIIGNYAFANNTTLEELDFPNLGRPGQNILEAELKDHNNYMINGFRVDIGHFAFKGCTALKSVTFNSVAVIGRSAFKDCTALDEVNFPMAWMIGENAFEGCTRLTEVRFQKVTKIGNEAFKNCTGLRNAYFSANPNRFPSNPPDPPPGHPINDVPSPDLMCTYDSVIFYPSVFSGCTALQSLDISRAWNVYFSKDVLEKTGNEISIRLFDGAGTYGHPQAESFLGEGNAVTVRKVNLYVPIVSSPTTQNISFNNDESIAYFIKERYPSIGVSIN